jgi:hypothetical protein
MVRSEIAGADRYQHGTKNGMIVHQINAFGNAFGLTAKSGPDRRPARW